MFLWYPNSQDEIWVQRKCIHNSVITKAWMLGNQKRCFQFFNLNKKEQKEIKKKKLLYNQHH